MSIPIRSTLPRRSAQRGTALVIALILLAAMTLLSLAAVNNSVLEMRMAGNDEWVMDAFQKAQSGAEVVVNNPDEYTVGVSAPGQSNTVNGGGETTVVDAAPDVYADFGAGDTLDVTVSMIGTSCQPPPRFNEESATSVKKYSRFTFRVDSGIDRTANGGSVSEVHQGFFQLGPKC